jgi:hypothetical protein
MVDMLYLHVQVHKADGASEFCSRKSLELEPEIAENI